MLGKNSDRTNFDCQPLFLHPRVQWPTGSQIDLGRITIPQVEETFAILGASPYWCWGYEEGINEHGVAIGNEGIRTKVFAELLAAQARGEEPAPGPTGMDLIRLGLERGRTAREALSDKEGNITLRWMMGNHPVYNSVNSSGFDASAWLFFVFFCGTAC